jgi:UDP-N-acetylmuramoylalanine--D-glutamate ligase
MMLVLIGSSNLKRDETASSSPAKKFSCSAWAIPACRARAPAGGARGRGQRGETPQTPPHMSVAKPCARSSAAYGAVDDARLQAARLLVVVGCRSPTGGGARHRRRRGGGGRRRTVRPRHRCAERAAESDTGHRHHRQRQKAVTAMCGDMCRMAGLVTCVAGNIGLRCWMRCGYRAGPPAPQVWVSCQLPARTTSA